MNKSVKDRILLTLLCEWGECMLVYDRMDLFVQHIKDHLEDWKTKTTEDDLQDDLHNKENTLSCLWKDCNSETRFKSWEEFIQHVNYHAFHQKLKCQGIALLKTLEDNRCSKCLLDHNSRNLIPDLPFKLVCHWLDCKTNFENPETFYGHVESHVEAYPSGNDVQGGCKCLWNGCQSLVKSKHKLRDHLRSHTQEKLFACPTCGGLFANATKFIDHVQRQVDPIALTYKCSYCSKMFPNKRFLRDHMRHHVYHYKCPFCDMTCPNPSSLRTHIRYRHSDYRPFICKICGFKTKLSIDLKKHLESHEEDWIKCQFEACLFRCRFPWEMNLHLRNKHEGIEESKYLCHLCSQKYSRATYLTQHLNKRHKLKKPSGHVRLKYKQHDDGFHRLQEFRYESSELQEQLVENLDQNPRRKDDDDHVVGDDEDHFVSDNDFDDYSVMPTVDNYSKVVLHNIADDNDDTGVGDDDDTGVGDDDDTGVGDDDDCNGGGHGARMELDSDLVSVLEEEEMLSE